MEALNDPEKIRSIDGAEEAQNIRDELQILKHELYGEILLIKERINQLEDARQFDDTVRVNFSNRKPVVKEQENLDLDLVDDS